MKKTFLHQKDAKLIPSEFMRARKPFLYSDSLSTQSQTLNREVFEYHLETLTSRNEERAFEIFCRRLAEHVICPNLRPQTGPTGGGDSKVDSETYPVSDKVSERWYQGLGREAAHELWAFAFSAKKKWRDKVKKDMASIASTNRGYKHAYFISNQFIPDKKRAQLERELTQTYGFKVHIFDRNWIVSNIYGKDLFYIAVETLNIAPCKKEDIIAGPNDLARQNELSNLEKKISDPTNYQDNKEDLIEDCLQVALIARGLECSRDKVDNLFFRAERLAKNYNSPQLKKIISSHGLTAFWWYDDVSFLSASYDRLEEIVFGSENIWDYEYILEVWHCLNASVLNQIVTEEDIKLDIHTEILINKLQGIIEWGGKSISLWARTQISLINLTRFTKDRVKLNSVFEELMTIIDSADSLLEYPLQPLIIIVMELSNIIEDSKEFDNLIEKIINISGQRLSEGHQGRLLIKQGWKKLENEKWDDAIKYFSRACSFLAKEEYLTEFYSALIGISFSYESAGLLWASRSASISALWQLLRLGEIEAKLPKQLLPLIRRIIRLEIQIGRIPAIISWSILMNDYQRFTDLNEDEKEEINFIDLAMGILILKSSYEDIRQVPEAPSILENTELFMANIASLYALGYLEEIAKDVGDYEENIPEFIINWYSQPAKNELPIKPEWGISESSVFRTHLNGCEILWITPLQKEAVLYSEVALAFIEAVFSTPFGFLIPYRSQIICNFEVILDEEAKQPSCQVFEDQFGKQELFIKCPLSFINKLSFTVEQRNFLIKIVENLIRISCFYSEGNLELLFKENVLNRAFLLLNLITSVENILSGKYYVNWKDVLKKDNLKLYPCLRKNEWWQGIVLPSIYPKIQTSNAEDSLNFDLVKHNHLQILDIINVPLWNRACGSGVAFSCVPGDQPIFAPVFKDKDAAKKIFLGLRNSVGNIDEQNLLRIILLTGIDKDNIFKYKVMFCPNLECETYSQQAQMTSLIPIGRIHSMNPSSSVNIENFLKCFSIYKSFIFAPAVMDLGNPEPSFLLEFGIEKKDINVIEAWNVQSNSVSAVMIDENCQPNVPPNISYPPYLETIALKQKLKKKMNDSSYFSDIKV